jgi:hypothetical protein
MAQELPILMTPDDARLMRDLLVALRNVRGTGSVQTKLVPNQSLSILGTATGPRRNESGILAQRYKVKSEQDDYLTCRTWDGTIEGDTDIAVAKPPSLRGGTGYYTIADVIGIWAIQPLIGGTGAVDGSANPVEWLDVSTGGTVGNLFPVNVTQTGGSAGNATTQCSYTYTVTDLNAVELGTVMSPVAAQRPTIGVMVAATKGSGYLSNGTFVLWWVNEKPNTVAGCSTS